VLPDHLAGTNEVDHDLNEENEFPDKVVGVEGTLVEMQWALISGLCSFSPLPMLHPNSTVGMLLPIPGTVAGSCQDTSSGCFLLQGRECVIERLSCFFKHS
jgi:hypothetical protein